MSIRSVTKQIRTALADDHLTACEAQKIVETAEKGPVTTGEARKIGDLYEKGDWFHRQTDPGGPIWQPRPPMYQSGAGARNTLMSFLVEHRVPAGENFSSVRNDIEASYMAINVWKKPTDEPDTKHLHPVFIRDGRSVGSDRIEAFLDTNKNEFFIQATGPDGSGPERLGPLWYGPFPVLEDTVSPQQAVDDANAALREVHGRASEEQLVDDDITGFVLEANKSVTVEVRKDPQWPEIDVLEAAFRYTEAAGLPNLEVFLQWPAELES